MTDNEIIKALEWCEQFEDNIVLSGVRGNKLISALQTMQTVKHVLKDYNRKKAEIRETRRDLLNEIISLKHQLETARAEAIKECIEKIKEEILFYSNMTEVDDFLDNLVEEMVGDSDA